MSEAERKLMKDAIETAIRAQRDSIRHRIRAAAWFMTTVVLACGCVVLAIR